MGSSTAAATSTTTMIRIAMKTGSDSPQHFLFLLGAFDDISCSSYRLSFSPSGHIVSRRGVPPKAGAGKADIRSDMLEFRR